MLVCVYFYVSMYFYALNNDVQVGNIQVLHGLFTNSNHSGFCIKLSQTLYAHVRDIPKCLIMSNFTL